jgi:hypothetical protein
LEEIFATFIDIKKERTPESRIVRVIINKIFGFNSKIYKKIFKIIFFKNILSWLILALEKIGKKKTQVIVNNNQALIPDSWLINFILYLIYITPVNIWSVLKKIKKIL